MISYLGSLDQFSPAAGRAGRCRQMSLCVGSTRRALARQPAVLAPSPRVLRAFLSVASCLGSQRFAGALPGCGVPFPSLAPARAAAAAGRVSGSLRNWGLFAGWEGVASLGLSLPLARPPASYLQRGWAGSSLEFLSPFVLRTAAVCSGQLIFPLSHSLKKSLPPTALRAFWPVPTLSNAAGSSPFLPHLLAAGAGVRGTFLLGVVFRHEICGPYLISPPG